jgi:hypothetical protein
MLWRTAVSSSSAFMPNEPSPWTTMTCLSGLASLAPIPLCRCVGLGIEQLVRMTVAAQENGPATVKGRPKPPLNFSSQFGLHLRNQQLAHPDRFRYGLIGIADWAVIGRGADRLSSDQALCHAAFKAFSIHPTKWSSLNGLFRKQTAPAFMARARTLSLG